MSGVFMSGSRLAFAEIIRPLGEQVWRKFVKKALGEFPTEDLRARLSGARSFLIIQVHGRTAGSASDPAVFKQDG